MHTVHIGLQSILRYKLQGRTGIGTDHLDSRFRHDHSRLVRRAVRCFAQSRMENHRRHVLPHGRLSTLHSPFPRVQHLFERMRIEDRRSCIHIRIPLLVGHGRNLFLDSRCDEGTRRWPSAVLTSASTSGRGIGTTTERNSHRCHGNGNHDATSGSGRYDRGGDCKKLSGREDDRDNVDNSSRCRCCGSGACGTCSNACISISGRKP
mmetsp:Transcript_19862/g.30112  ORF Transcript_19862/g.30112 Transcript_19862/m.30112 type:complete len:207 (+) Transcript_19862:439-1059(+)